MIMISLQPPKARTIKSVKVEKKLRKKIRAAFEAGQTRDLRQLMKRYLNSFDVKLAATSVANQKLKPHRKVPKKSLIGIAENLNPLKGTDEKVIVHFTPKKSDENQFRPIMDFGIRNRALQQIALWLLSACSDLHPHQFANAGGTKAAITEVLEALNGGYTYTSEIDIKNCFPSVDGERMSELLPVPTETTHNVILSRYLNPTPGNIIHYFGLDNVSDLTDEVSDPINIALSEARRGIPQGSAVSSLVIELLLAPTISGLTDVGRVFSYCDNFFLMAKTNDDLVLMMNSLMDALKKHPAGPFMPKIISVSEPGKSFQLLGYKLNRRAGTFYAAPSGENLVTFNRHFDRSLDKIQDGDLTPDTVKRLCKNLERYVRSWAGAFSLWKGAEKFRNDKLKEIQTTVSTKSIPATFSDPKENDHE